AVFDAGIGACVAASQDASNDVCCCDPQVTNDYTTQSVDLCTGGEVEITWTITDLCDTTEVTATFTVTPPADVTYTEPLDDAVTRSEERREASGDAARAAWDEAQQAAMN